MKRYIGVISLLVLTALLAGCVGSSSGQVYSRGQARQLQTVQMGTVESVQPVRIEGAKSGIGAVGGAVAGGVAGSTIGGGKGRTLAALGGALAGAAAGAFTEEKLTDADGIEITVTLDRGGIISIVQEDDVMFFVGDRVRLLEGGDGITRVVR